MFHGGKPCGILMEQCKVDSSAAEYSSFICQKNHYCSVQWKTKCDYSIALQEKLRVAVLVSQAALSFIQGEFSKTCATWDLTFVVTSYWSST